MEEIKCCSDNCSHWFTDITYDNINDEIICPNCNERYIICYDEYWEEGMEYEDSMWWLEKVE